ncbi:hypothetical protein [Sinorhizobium meliloti]|uniref:hypothetical protein n=1 Tax=Rhizobium meliloti TaxID=382 RepID=UPI001F3601AE|nr:hypothetical protein [Sinorhizobium meliloti]
MHAAETRIIADIDNRLDSVTRGRLDVLIAEKTHDRQSRFSWLREPAPRVASASLAGILDKIELVRGIGTPAVPIDRRYEPRMEQFAREGVRYTAQAFQQMGSARRHVILVATLREFEATLTDTAIGMFGSLIGRAHLRARKRLEQTVAASADQGRDRLIRVAGVREAVSKAARAGGDIAAAVAAVASLDTIDADAALLRRTTRSGQDNAISEIGPEYRTFKRSGPRFLKAFASRAARYRAAPRSDGDPGRTLRRLAHAAP